MTDVVFYVKTYKTFSDAPSVWMYHTEPDTADGMKKAMKRYNEHIEAMKESNSDIVRVELVRSTIQYEPYKVTREMIANQGVMPMEWE
jgi:hypothetical protein